MSARFRIGIIDTGVNPWHSHVRGAVEGMRIYVDAAGKIIEDDDFRDPAGHGTAVAGVLRQGLPDAELYVLRVFDADLKAYPSLVARALLLGAGAGCQVINLSLGMPPGPGGEQLAEACRIVQDAGVTLVAAGHPQKPELLPASLPGVIGVVSAEHLRPGDIEVHPDAACIYAACGWPRDLEMLPAGGNLWGNSFACARVALHLALKLGAGSAIDVVDSGDIRRSN